MASKEVFVSPGGVRLIGGLEWRVLDANQSSDAGLRSTAKERSASYAVTSTSSLIETVQAGKKNKEVRRVSGGFFSSVEEGEGPGKKAHSLAAAFALWTSNHEKAALFVRTNAGKIAVVVVLHGLPSLDKVIDNESEAYEIVAGYIKEHPSISIFADDIEKFPRAVVEHGLFEGIAAAAGKTTVIKSIPADVVQLSVIAVVVITAIGGYQWWSGIKAEEARKAAQMRAIEADPVPKYLEALSNQRGSLGSSRTSMEATFRAAGKVPVSVNGWNLKSVECSFGSDCVAQYERNSGTFDDLKKGVPFLSLDQAGSMDLNAGRMTWKQEMEAELLDAEKSPFALPAFLEGSAGSQFQDWMVAGLGLTIQAPALWPEVADIPSGFKHPQAVALGTFEVSDIPLPLVEEVITKAPPNIIWSRFFIQIGETKGDPLMQAKVKINGSYYVQN